ncbi:anosmin-1 isoform X1, partial [Tachysurus ichikawai]
ESFIHLSGLLFSCQYRVTVHTLRAKKHSELGTVTFTTPSCPAVRSKSHKSIICPGEEAAVKVASKPENLTASFTANGENVTGHFFWRVSRPQPHQPITGFQVTWADVTVVNRENSIPNSIVSQSQILPPESFIHLSGLLFSCQYRVTVHTLRAKKHSELGTVTFTTPSCPAVRSKSHKSIICPGEEAAVKVASKPENLTASFTANGENVTGHFFWRVSRPQPHQPITGFQVTWADVTVVNRENSIPNSIVSQSQILPP